MTAPDLLAKADSVFKSREYLKSREFYRQAADAAKTAGDNSTQTEAQAMIARTCLILDKKEEGRQILAQAEKTATKSVYLLCQAPGLLTGRDFSIFPEWNSPTLINRGDSTDDTTTHNLDCVFSV